jgi:zinc transport system substrate-binding protein
MWRRVLLPLVALLPVASLSACSATASDAEVVTSFYPLQFVAERVVGDDAEVANLTKPGVEPHELDLSPRQVATLSGAKVAFYESGLQPAVDEAVEQNGPEHVVDAAKAVGLRQGDGGPDPHFWLDPTLLAEAATAFTDAISDADPAHAADYRRNNAALQADLRRLDADIRTGLEDCRTRTLVVSHDAFEYFGRRYGLEVEPIAGLSPDAEPSGQHLAQLADLARDKGITTVFSETLASPKFADTLADEVGVGTAVLDPIEGLTNTDSEDDYLTLMRADLAAIRKAGGCR